MNLSAWPALRDRTAAPAADPNIDGDRPSPLEHAMARNILQRAGVALALGGSFASTSAQASERVATRTTLAPTARATVVAAVRLVDGRPHTAGAGRSGAQPTRDVILPPRRTVGVEGRPSATPTFDMP